MTDEEIDQMLADRMRECQKKANTPEALEKKRQTRAAKLSLRERTKMLLEAAVTDDEIESAEELRSLGIDITQQDLVNLAILRKAKAYGDVESARYLRDTSGQKPVDGLALGNLEDKPFEQLDLSRLSNDELIRLIGKKSEASSGE